MLSCFKNLIRTKKAVEQDESTPEDHVEKQTVLPAVLPQSIASEGSKGNKLGDLVAQSDRPHRNLWQEAFAKLTDDQRDSLSDIEKSQGPSVVQSVAEETEKKYLESHKGGCKGKKHNSLRAAAEKILLSVLRSKKLIDAGVAFDPTGHAASAWTIISLGLQMMENDIDRRQALFEASGIVTDTLARCAAIEACYRDDRDLPDSAHLEDTIVEDYLSILEFSAEMASQGKMNIGQRVLKSINSLDSGPLQDLKKKLSAREEDLQKWNHIIGIQYHKREMEAMKLMVTSMLDNRDQVMQQLFLKEERTILKWLYDYDFSAIHRSAILEPEPGTGLWIFDNPNYKKWEKLDSRLLWLYGNSGSGKTVLCSQIIKNLQDLCAKDASYALAYWYFSYSSQRSLDLYNLLCSIIRQLCANTQTLPDKIRELWNVHHRGDLPTRDSLEEALDVLIAGLTAADQTAFIVLDALDECPLSIEKPISGPQQVSERKDTLRWVREFTAKHENVRVMILSRDEHDIRASFDKTLQVDVARGVVDDVHLFISNCINRMVEDRRWKDSYKEAMFSRVEGVSEKRFRWASLMQRKFSQCLDRKAMDKALENLPKTLEDMYADILTKQIPEEHREQTRLILMWLAYSIRPVRLGELASAALIDEPTDVLQICSTSLITFSRETICLSEEATGTAWMKDPIRESEEDIIVKFDHFSVKEYLMSEELLASSGGPVFYFFVPPLLAHLSIAQQSVSYLLGTNGSPFTKEEMYVTRTEERVYYDMDGDPEPGNTKLFTEYHLATKYWAEFPLLEYSTFWHRHVWEADAIEARLAAVDASKPNSSTLKADTQSILSQAENLRIQIHKLFWGEFSQSFENWFRLLTIFTYEIPYKKSHYLYYNQKFSGVPSPLWLASLLNLPDTVRRLLQSEMGPGERDFVCFLEHQPDFDRTPVQIATKCGHLKVLKVLLETDVQIQQSEFAHLVQNLERNTSAVLNTILEACPHLRITKHIVERTFRQKGAQADCYKFILNSPNLVNLTKAMFVLMVGNVRCNSASRAADVELVEAIMRRGEDVGYSRDEMTGALVQSEKCEQSTGLSNDRNRTLSINQDLLALMYANKYCGARMLAIVLVNYKGVQISEELLAWIVADRGKNLLADVLKQCKDVQISQKLLASMITKGHYEPEMLAVVFKHRKGIHISQDFLVSAVTYLFKGHRKLLDLILDYDRSIEVSEETLRAAAGEYSGAAILSAILSHKKMIEISEDTLKTAAGINLADQKFFWSFSVITR